MSTLVVVIIVIVVVVVVGLIALLVRREQQRRHLRENFGPEYERTLQDQESPRAADRELAAREKRHAALDIKPLSSESQRRFTERWALVQAQFVDQPTAAVSDADRLLIEVMAERGYPTEGYEQQLSDLSVKHSRTLKHYRAAHETMHGQETTQSSTEDLRDAMVRYRTVFEDLLTEGGDSGHDRNGHDNTARDGVDGTKHDRKARTDASNGSN
jgi:hypothetical protein